LTFSAFVSSFTFNYILYAFEHTCNYIALDFEHVICIVQSWVYLNMILMININNYVTKHKWYFVTSFVFFSISFALLKSYRQTVVSIYVDIEYKFNWLYSINEITYTRIFNLLTVFVCHLYYLVSSYMCAYEQLIWGE
jgi:hypothetical protein